MVLLSTLASVLILAFTRSGMGASGDSVHYLMGAGNLAAGNGYARISGGGEIKPITGFPPFFSIVLAGIEASGTHPASGVRPLHAVLFGATIFIAGWIIFKHTGSSWASILGCSLLLSGVHLVEGFGWIMSEPLYIVLSLVVLGWLSVFLKSPTFWPAVALGLLAGMATLTRYMGFALVATGGLAIFSATQGRWRRRISYSLLFVGIALLPVVLWLARNASLAGTATNREWAFHPIRSELVRTYADELASWVVPRSLEVPRIRHRLLIGASVLAGSLLLMVIEGRKAGARRVFPRTGSLAHLPSVLLQYSVWYLIVLFINSTFLDAATTLGAVSRYLLPLYVTTVVLAVVVVHKLVVTTPSYSASRVLVLVGWTGLVVGNAVQTWDWVRHPESHLGYVSIRESFPDVALRLQQFRGDRPIISNNPELVYLMAGRPAYMIPIQIDEYSLEPRADFQDQLGSAQSLLDAGGLLVIFYHRPSTDNELAVMELLELEATYEAPIATFFEAEG